MKKILVYGMSNDYGGIQSFFLNLIQYSDSNHIKYDFVLSSESPVKYASKINENKGEIYQITPWGKNPLIHKKQLKNILRNKTYDYVWVNTTSASNLTVFKTVKKNSNAKLIIHAHGSAFETRNKGLKKYLLNILHEVNKNKLKKYGDFYFAVSEEASVWLFNETSDVNDKISIINNGIDTKLYSFDKGIRNNIREILNLNDAVTLIQVGRIESVKNHFFTLAVFKKLLSKNESSRLLIVGTGALEVEVKEKAEKLGITEHIEFLGYQTEIEEYLMAADCLILPSFSEGLPLTVIEAQAASLKSVVSSEAVPKTADVTGLVSFLSINESPEKWAEEIISTTVEYSRESQFKKIKNKGFDVTNTVKEVNQILDL